MRSATAFLPPCMMTFMNLARSTLPYLGSGRISRLGTSRRRGMVSPLCFSWRPVQGAARAIKTLTYSTQYRVTTLERAASPVQHLGFTENESCLGFLGLLGAVLGARLLAVFHA